eukprot:CAMPEP_0119292514 /NCGR_PEP_ID=MMETSP1329-20130426/44289_1 /TAXON_ID=114041 /ORGANISM="Genus nov. species nov., Strain RCC1024" /LENGTH=65 /DNA_ID=CAMNT_0007293355 /DNA_START=37 /DNA_END=230 /DNA_ORIENTATION=-
MGERAAPSGSGADASTRGAAALRLLSQGALAVSLLQRWYLQQRLRPSALFTSAARRLCRVLRAGS